jgi:hypothetical protein
VRSPRTRERICPAPANRGTRFEDGDRLRTDSTRRRRGGPPKLAAYTHLLLFGEATPADMVTATRGTYDGPLVVGEDLMQFEIGDEVRVNRSA